VLHIPESSAELSAELITQLLQPRHPGAQLDSLSKTPIGTGQVGDSIRLHLSYASSVQGPPTLVVKLPSNDPQSRATAWALRSYEVEVQFYRQLANSLSVRTPICYATQLDVHAERFLLLMEDLTPAVQGDQIRGCTPDQAATAIGELPKLHSPHWGDRELAGIEWLNRSNPEQTAQFIPKLYAGFCERFAAQLPVEVLAIGERLMKNLSRYLQNRQPPYTLQHGDYRLDNLLFGADHTVGVVDWQVMTHGSGLSDVAYFLGAGLTVEDRRTHESALVQEYHRALLGRGVQDYDWNQCWLDYRRYAFSGFIMAVAASMIVVQTDRGDEMFLTMAQRHGQQILDLNAAEFLT
jgi:Phosphotransferase enzyme family